MLRERSAQGVFGACALPFAIALIAGCASRDGPAVEDPVRLRSVSFAMASDTNDNRPARIDLVRVPDDERIPDLIAIETSAWFAEQGEAFRAANPDALIDRWEVVPDRVSGPFNVRAKGKFAGVLFCDTDAGTPPLRVRRNGHLTIDIDDAGCLINGDRRKESFINRLRRSRSTRLSFVVADETNGNRPFTVQLVRVGDADLLTDLTRLHASAWFGKGGRTFRERHPQALYDAWELVPGGSFGPFPLAVNRKIPGVLFCGTPGGSPLPLQWAGQRDVTIHIDRQGCRLADEPKRKRRRWIPWSARPPAGKDAPAIPRNARLAIQPEVPKARAELPGSLQAIQPEVPKARAELPGSFQAIQPEVPKARAELPGSFQAIQLIALGSRGGLQRFVNDNDLSLMSGVIVEKDGKRFFALLAGIYEDRETAERAVHSLPEKLREHGPWVRSLESLRAAMARAERLPDEGL